MIDQRTIDKEKVVKVIRSCVTMEQLEVAEQMARNFFRLHDSGPWGDVPDFEGFFDQLEFEKEMENKGKAKPKSTHSTRRNYIPPVSLF